MNRREFLRNVLLWSAGASMQVPCWSISGAASFPEAPSELVVGKGGAYQELVEKLLAELGGIGRFVKSGDTVVVKPNIGWDRSPEQGANTHPMVVKSLVEQALDGGASKVKVFDYTCNEKRRCYVNSGIHDAIKEIGDRRVRLEHIDKRKFVPVDIKKGRSLTRWDIYKDALTADSYINVPAAKHHGLSRLTLGLKNSMGVIGGNRGSLHHDLGRKLADLATVVQPSLTVIDATRLLMRNGPQGGSIKDVEKADTLIGSADPVAADAYAATLFGLEPGDIDSTAAAYEMGLGQMDLEKVVIRKVRV